jgi:hypothetical protein
VFHSGLPSLTPKAKRWTDSSVMTEGRIGLDTPIRSTAA